jgi:hypothetical protein
MVLHARTDHANGAASVLFRSAAPFGISAEARLYHRVRVTRQP